jgi:ABC-type transport system involved in multi-copper enzyme maturation permease subunit
MISKNERVLLVIFAGFSFLIINGVFVYCTLSQPGLLLEALRNPVSLIFIVEALLLVVLLGYYLRKWKVTSMSLALFIFLSIVGSLGFSVPLAILKCPEG